MNIAEIARTIDQRLALEGRELSSEFNTEAVVRLVLRAALEIHDQPPDPDLMLVTDVTDEITR